MQLKEENNTKQHTVKQYTHFYLYFEHMDMVSKSCKTELQDNPRNSQSSKVYFTLYTLIDNAKICFLYDYGKEIKEQPMWMNVGWLKGNCGNKDGRW